MGTVFSRSNTSFRIHFSNIYLVVPDFPTECQSINTTIFSWSHHHLELVGFSICTLIDARRLQYYTSMQIYNVYLKKNSKYLNFVLGLYIVAIYGCQICKVALREQNYWGILQLPVPHRFHIPSCPVLHILFDTSQRMKLALRQC